MRAQVDLNAKGLLQVPSRILLGETVVAPVPLHTIDRVEIDPAT